MSPSSLFSVPTCRKRMKTWDRSKLTVALRRSLPKFRISHIKSMEVVCENGSKLVLGRESSRVFGRGSGFYSDDRTVSRRHLLLEVKTSEGINGASKETRVLFEVIGRNPIWVRSGIDGGIETFRRSEKGEMAVGDSFCVGGKQPTWFRLKEGAEVEEGSPVDLDGEEEIAESSGRSIDFDEIDPVQEFGFIVLGHEFEVYGNRVIRDPKKWNWFLEEPRKNSDDDEDYGRKDRRGLNRKRKKGVNSDDEEWTDEIEDVTKMVSKTKVPKLKYSTRSKDHSIPLKDTRGSKTDYSNKDYKEEEDEDDETLGGFIVDDVDNEELSGQEEEEEEEEEEEVLDDDEEQED